MGSGRPKSGSGVLKRVFNDARRLSAALVLGSAVLLIALNVVPLVPAAGAGPDAVMTPAGYDAVAVPRGDDTSNLVVDLPFAMNWNGTDFTQIYINMNGNCTFGSGFTSYNPNTSLAGTNMNIMAPLWADVDTRNTAASQVTYSDTTAGNVPQVDGHDAFFVNWIGVASYNNQSTPTDSFQLVLIDRSDTGAGNFDFVFNYDVLTWDLGDVSNTRARAGWGQDGSGFELPGSGVAAWSASTLLDTSDPATSLVQNSMNSGGQLGRYVFEVRGGQTPNVPPALSVTDVTLEGNAPDSYIGYTGAGDVIASDADGSIVSLTSDMPAVLPLGTTTVTWTATDDQGLAVSEVQTIIVEDTTPPDNPLLVSPSHATGVWTTDNVVTVDSSGATDICTGVDGFSYGWSQDSPAIPDTVLDPATGSTVTTDVPVTVDEQTFPDATWPATWTRSSTTWVRLTNTAGHTHGSYAAEIWANNNTRRTADFYRDYDLTALTSASLSFWDEVSLSRNGSYARVEYSTDGGANYTQLQELDRNTASGWTARSYSLPVGGVVRVRFSGSCARSTEYVDWDDITVAGVSTTTLSTLATSSTSSLADGAWYFNLHSVDNAGNWSTPTNMGPFLVDRTAPVTSDDAPVGWSAIDIPVTLTVSDQGVVDTTLYSLNGGAPTLYAGSILVSQEGTSTLQYWSIDAAGNTETPRTTTVRIDRTPPTAPTSLSASALSTSSVETTWTSSSDTPSGVSYYAVYRDGAIVATTTATTFTDTGLTPGATYSYTVVAVDEAGNESAPSPVASATTPLSVLWMSVSAPSVDTGPIDPGIVSTVTSATAVTVGGYGDVEYDFSCSALDFANIDPMSPTPSFGIDAMSYVTGGWLTLTSQPFGPTQHVINSGMGAPAVWEHVYIFDYSVDAPWTCEPGTYTTTVTYSLVLR